MFKNAMGIKALTALLNDAWKTGEVDQKWKDVVLVRLYKGKGLKNKCDSYRAISLISHVGKLLERILVDRLQTIINNQPKLESSMQWCGAGKSTQDGILLVKTAMDCARREGRPFFLAFCDLRAAFDTVPRALLIEILTHSGVPPRMLEVIKSLHNGAHAKIRWADGSFSDAFPLQQGLKQGAVFSPCLFALFFHCVTSAVKRKFVEEGLGAEAITTRARKQTGTAAARGQRSRAWSTIPLSCIEYADDVALTAYSEQDLQRMVNIFGTVCADFGLSLSATKTKVMKVDHHVAAEAEPPGADADDSEDESDGEAADESSRGSDKGTAAAPMNILFGKVRLAQVTRFCYLGHTLNSRGTLLDEIAIRCAMMHRSFSRLETNVFCNPHVSTTIKLETFNAIVVPNGFYASELWWSISRTEERKLDAVMFYLLKVLLGFRLSYPYVPHISIIEHAAKYGVIIMPAAVRVSLNVLRYMGYIVRREVRLSEKATPQASPHTALMSASATYLTAAGAAARASPDEPPAGLPAGTGVKLDCRTFATGVTETLRSAGLVTDAWMVEGTKKIWKNFTEVTIRPTLMRSWIDKKISEKAARDATRPQRAAKKAEREKAAAEMKQSAWEAGTKHRNTCIVCKQQLAAPDAKDPKAEEATLQLMCYNRNKKGRDCPAVCHATCAGLSKTTPHDRSYSEWYCRDCVPPQWSPPPTLPALVVPALPADSIPYRYHTAHDDRNRGVNILKLWADMVEETDGESF
jgi:hypothetical protein